MELDNFIVLKINNKNQLRIMNYELRIKKQKAFTLIELMVVMTIIIVISVVAMVSYAGSGKKARDSRRIADLEKIRLALEVIRQTGTTYPANPSALEPTYLSKVPVDPKTGAGYSYTPGATNYTYTLDATMEDLGTTNMAGNIYRVTNP